MDNKYRGFFKEFKELTIKGNMVDLAVGIIIGASFNKIISSLVGDILTPLLGLFTGGINLKDRHWTFASIYGNTPITINYGIFLQNIIEFLIIALVVFITIKIMIRLHLKKKNEPPPPPTPSREEILLAEIRDVLKIKKTL
jgi:large conductance mechanosensitive channel